MNSTHFHEIYIAPSAFLIADSLMGLSIQTMRNQDWTEVSWQNNVDNAKFIVKTRLDNDFPIERTYFQWSSLFLH